MIKQGFTKKHNRALTSDQWHVVHAAWCGECVPDPSFVRNIVSEHDDRAAAISAATTLAASVNATVRQRPKEQRDQIFVRPPSFKSLKLATRRTQKRPRRRGPHKA
jgi:hypothetical protein